MSVEYDPAIWVPSPFYWPGRAGYTPRWVILHSTTDGQSARAVAARFRDPRIQISAHYIVGQDGEVVQCVSEEDSAWSNGTLTEGHAAWWAPDPNPNYLTLSIEHVKVQADRSDDLTPAQKAASFALTAHLCTRWHIPRHPAGFAGGITGHFALDPVDHARCPGTYPWGELFAYLNQHAIGQKGRLPVTVGAATGFYGLVTTEQHDVWYCPQRRTELSEPFLSYYQSLRSAHGNATSILGLPISNAYTGNDGLLRQDFERGTLIHDPEHRTGGWTIVHAPLGRELREMHESNAELRALVASLQQRNQPLQEHHEATSADALDPESLQITLVPAREQTAASAGQETSPSVIGRASPILAPPAPYDEEESNAQLALLRQRLQRLDKRLNDQDTVHSQVRAEMLHLRNELRRLADTANRPARAGRWLIAVLYAVLAAIAAGFAAFWQQGNGGLTVTLPVAIAMAAAAILLALAIYHSLHTHSHRA